MANLKIVTHNVYPPIPIRRFDWCAYFDGEEEAQRYGWGETEQDAIDDLRESHAEYCRRVAETPALAQKEETE